MALPGSGAALWRPGLLIHRDLLRAVGGIRPLPLMEDVDLVRRLGRRRLVGAGRGRDHLGGEVAAPGLVPPLAAQSGVPGAVFRRRAAAADRAALRMRDTVVVFARAPRLGAVKRRLARDIGDRAALRFHVATLTRLLRALVADRRFRTVLAITPDHARFRLPVRVARIPQGGGDLGVRMDRAFRRFPRGRVAIIGCDIPDAGPRTMRARRSARWAARMRRSVRRRTAATGWWRCRRAGRRVRSPRCAGPPSTRWRTRWRTSPAGGSHCCARCTMWIPPRTGTARITPGSAGGNRAAPPPASGESCGASSPPTRSRSAARRP